MKRDLKLLMEGANVEELEVGGYKFRFNFLIFKTKCKLEELSAYIIKNKNNKEATRGFNTYFNGTEGKTYFEVISFKKKKFDVVIYPF